MELILFISTVDNYLGFQNASIQQVVSNVHLDNWFREINHSFDHNCKFTLHAGFYIIVYSISDGLIDEFLACHTAILFIKVWLEDYEDASYYLKYDIWCHYWTYIMIKATVQWGWSSFTLPLWSRLFVRSLAFLICDIVMSSECQMKFLVEVAVNYGCIMTYWLLLFFIGILLLSGMSTSFKILKIFEKLLLFLNIKRFWLSCWFG